MTRFRQADIMLPGGGQGNAVAAQIDRQARDKQLAQDRQFQLANLVIGREANIRETESKERIANRGLDIEEKRADLDAEIKRKEFDLSKEESKDERIRKQKELDALIKHREELLKFAKEKFKWTTESELRQFKENVRRWNKDYGFKLKQFDALTEREQIKLEQFVKDSEAKRWLAKQKEVREGKAFEIKMASDKFLLEKMKFEFDEFKKDLKRMEPFKEEKLAYDLKVLRARSRKLDREIKNAEEMWKAETELQDSPRRRVQIRMVRDRFMDTMPTRGSEDYLRRSFEVVRRWFNSNEKFGKPGSDERHALNNYLYMLKNTWLAAAGRSLSDPESNE